MTIWEWKVPLTPSGNRLDLGGLKLSAPEDLNLERTYLPEGVIEGVIG